MEKTLQSEQDLQGRPISIRKKQPELPGFEDQLLLNQLLVLTRVGTDLVVQLETAADPVFLDEAEIAALVLRCYGARKSRGLKLRGAWLGPKGIELSFRTLVQDQEVLWSLRLTRLQAG